MRAPDLVRLFIYKRWTEMDKIQYIKGEEE